MSSAVQHSGQPEAVPAASYRAAVTPDRLATLAPSPHSRLHTAIIQAPRLLPLMWHLYTARMTENVVDIDVVILGGGCAGLWALNVLRGAGYSAALFDSGDLGSGQTVHSQGMIHGGLKYALGGVAGEDADALAGMPGAWRDCLSGRGSVDLRGCEIASDNVLLWSAGDLSSRVAALLASRLVHGNAGALHPGEYPSPFDSPDFRGRLFRLEDFVIDTGSLLASLARPWQASIFGIDWSCSSLRVEDGHAVLKLPGTTLRPRQLLLCAGAGNAGLLQALGASAPVMQRRPLTQVLVRHERLVPLFAHCIGRSSSPKLTVSTHTSRDGEVTWYLGGDVATAESLAPAARVARAQEELAATLPWLDLEGGDWRTVTLDRAEPCHPGGRKPAGVSLERAADLANTLVAWPVKLALCPALGEQLLASLRQAGIGPGTTPELSGLASLSRPGFATPCWETAFA